MKRMMALVSLLQMIAHADCISQVIGYQHHDLKQGWNEITVGFEAFGEAAMFSTLDRVCRFSPPEGIVGDEIVFDLDGFHQKYRIDSVNTSNTTNYSLSLAINTRVLPREISFDWIPTPKVFWINHLSTNSVTCSTSGELSFSNMCKLENSDLATFGAKGKVEGIVVRPISTNDVGLAYTFKGGRMKVEPYVVPMKQQTDRTSK